MDPELQSLYDAIHTYKQSLIARLDKIDNDLQLVMTDLQTPTTITESVRKYEISMQMVKMLPHYLKMLEMCRNVSDDIASKLSQLERDVPPEKDIRNSNPFLADMAEVNENKPNLNKTPDKNLSKPTYCEVAPQVPDIEQEPKCTQVKADRESSEFKAETNPSQRPTEVPATVSEDNLELSDSPLDDKHVYARNLATKNWREQVLKLLEGKNRKGKTSQNQDKGGIVEIPQEELNSGQTCIVNYIISPSEFYIQTDPSLLEIVESSFNEELNRQCNVFTNKFASKEEARRKLGDFCFAYIIEEKKTFRVEVLDWLDHEPDRVRIQLVDHGNKLLCSFKNLGKMSKLYALFPKMATRCHLAGVHSPNPRFDTLWLKASIEFFGTLCEKNTKFLLIYVYNEGESYAVDLQEESDPDADSLGEVLVKKGYARQDPVSDVYSEDEIEEVDNINELITGYDAQDEARICPFTDSSGRCFKGRSCRFEHAQLSRDGVTTDKVLALSQATQPEGIMPAEDQIVDVLITGYINTCHFYAHVLHQRSDGNLYNDDFQQLQENMKSNNRVSTYEFYKIYPGMSEFILVRDGNDWYRGCCIGFCSTDTIEVFFVDFGYTKEVKMKNIRHMKEDFLLVPFQALECIVYDSQERKDVTEDDSSSFFFNYMNMEIFQARVVESGKPLMLQLWGSNGADMSQILREWDLAEDRIDLRPAKDCPLSCA